MTRHSRTRLDAIGLQAKLDTFAFKNVLYCRGNIFIVSADNSLACFDNSYFTAEPSIDLGELKSDVADNSAFFLHLIHDDITVHYGSRSIDAHKSKRTRP